MQRRRLLALLSTALGGSIAGCPAVGDEPAGRTPTATTTSAPAETDTPSTSPTTTPDDVLDLPSIPAGEWPMPRRDYRNTGVAPEAPGPSAPVETAWTVPIDGEVTSTPIVAGDTVYVGVDPPQSDTQSEDEDTVYGVGGAPTPPPPPSGSQIDQGRLLALDLATGEQQWRTPVMGKTPRVYATDEAIITATNGLVYEAIQPSDGQSLWTMSLLEKVFAETNGQQPVPDESGWLLTANGRLYVPARTSPLLTVLDAGSGDVDRYLPNANPDMDGESIAPPALTGDTAYLATALGVHNSASDLHAFDLETGDRRWGRKIGGSGGWPVVAGETVYVATGGTPPDPNLIATPHRGSLTAFDRQTGTERWQFKPEDEFVYILTPSLPLGDAVYTVALTADDEWSLRALDRATGEERWQQALPVAAFSSPSSLDLPSMPIAGKDMVYVPTGPGTIHAFSTSGERRWRYTVGDDIITSLSVVGETLLVGTTDGTVHALR